MIFEQSGPEYGDATAPYNVILKENNVCVGKFIKDMLKQRPDDWGDIYIPYCSNIRYVKGRIITGFLLLDEVYHRKIKRIRANGGWGLMNYFIEVED